MPKPTGSAAALPMGLAVPHPGALPLRCRGTLVLVAAAAALSIGLAYVTALPRSAPAAGSWVYADSAPGALAGVPATHSHAAATSFALVYSTSAGARVMLRQSSSAVRSRRFSVPLDGPSPEPLIERAGTPPAPRAVGSRVFVRTRIVSSGSRSSVVRARAASDPATTSTNTSGGWRWAAISWYGPGFYGQRTACGLTYTRSIIGVANRSLPCGTRVQFRHAGRIVTAPVIDRGPYAGGRSFDLSAGLCRALAHCYTGRIQWRLP